MKLRYPFAVVVALGIYALTQVFALTTIVCEDDRNRMSCFLERSGKQVSAVYATIEYEGGVFIGKNMNSSVILSAGGEEISKTYAYISVVPETQLFKAGTSEGRILYLNNVGEVVPPPR